MLSRLIKVVLDKILFANHLTYLIVGMLFFCGGFFFENVNISASLIGVATGILVFLWYPAFAISKKDVGSRPSL